MFHELGIMELEVIICENTTIIWMDVCVGT